MQNATPIAHPLRHDPAARRPINAKADRHFVTALARGLDVLGAFRPQDRMLGNQELARRCGLPKSTISRLTYTLTKHGYLEHVDDERGSPGYRLGSAVLALGSTMLARMDVREMARPMMQDLADRSKAMVSLGTRDRLSMIYVETCRSESALTLSLNVGSRIQLATSAMGRAWLARCSDTQRASLMDRIRDRRPAEWPRVRDGIERAIAQYAQMGCCTSFGEWQEQVNAIGVAFQAPGSRSLMAINCGGLAFHLSPDFLLHEVRPRLVELARRLEQPGAR